MRRLEKVTVLFPIDLHEHLSRLAAEQNIDLGELVRRACVAHYGPTSTQGDRLEAVRKLANLSLPVGDIEDLYAK